MNEGAALRKLLGRMPKKGALRVRRVGEVDADDHVREDVLLSDGSGMSIPTYVLVPKDLSGKAPGVVAIHQHGGQFHLGRSEPAGLAGDPDSHYGLELVRRGYVVAVPDLLCFESRRPPDLRDAPPDKLAGVAYERFEFSRAILVGSTLQARYLSDLTTVVDYLRSRPDVIASRIGAIGHSLGGQQVCYLMLYDKRVCAGVCSCGIGTWRTILADGVIHNFASYMPGMLLVGDTDVLLPGIAPRHLFISAGEDDGIFPVRGVRALGRAMRARYRERGAADAFKLVVSPGGHGFPPQVRAMAYEHIDSRLRM